MKLDTLTAMRGLTIQIRETISRALTGTESCSGSCQGCTVK